VRTTNIGMIVLGVLALAAAVMLPGVHLPI